LDTNTIITYLACIIILFLLGRIFILPLKSILKLILNSILGGVLIYVINLVGANFGFHIGLNLVTTILVGILRNSWMSSSHFFKIYDMLNKKSGFATCTDCFVIARIKET